MRRLLKAGCSRIFKEQVSSTARNRPERERLFDHLREGNSVVVSHLDRLARSTKSLLEIAETLTDRRAGLKSLAEPWADTKLPTGRLVMTVLAGIAEVERELIKERSSSGRAAVRFRGALGGASLARGAGRPGPGRDPRDSAPEGELQANGPSSQRAPH